jgi:glutamate racemase
LNNTCNDTSNNTAKKTAARPVKIAIFDSGVGGLSIVNHVRALIPQASLVYVADNELFPYGLLEEQRLINRVVAILNQVMQQQSLDIVIIACNSASTLVLPSLRQLLTIPVVGVVPAIKPAALQSQSKVIGLLATPGTIKRDYTDELIAEFGQNADIIRCGSSELVRLVEHKLAGEEISPDSVAPLLTPLTNHPRWLEMDTIVLACTHFPLIQAELALAAPQIKFWVDSGEAVARRVNSLLNFTPTSKPRGQLELALFTKLNQVNPSLLATLNHFGFGQLEQLTLPSANTA